MIDDPLYEGIRLKMVFLARCSPFFFPFFFLFFSRCSDPLSLFSGHRFDRGSGIMLERRKIDAAKLAELERLSLAPFFSFFFFFFSLRVLGW